MASETSIPYWHQHLGSATRSYSHCWFVQAHNKRKIVQRLYETLALTQREIDNFGLVSDKHCSVKRNDHNSDRTSSAQPSDHGISQLVARKEPNPRLPNSSNVSITHKARLKRYRWYERPYEGSARTQRKANNHHQRLEQAQRSAER